MKREGNSSRYPAMLGCERIKRLDCGRIAQDHGNLPAFGAHGGLALGSGFHGSSRNQFGGQINKLRQDGHALGHRNFRHQNAVAAQLFYNEHAGLVARLLDFAETDHFANFHLDSRVGPIPTMCQSYTVTSDVSTGI